MAMVTALAALATVAALARPARAQSFPADGAYTALPCGHQVMTDGRRDEPGANDERDLVGDLDDAAGYRAVDANFLYLRLRLDADAVPGGAIQPYQWGVEIDTDGDAETYEILGLVDSVSGEVLLFRNSATTVRNDPTDPADIPAVMTYPLASHARSTLAAGSSFGSNDDFYLSFALPWADLRPLGLEPTTPVRVWAASSTAANTLNGDFACHNGAGGDPQLSDADSDRTVLDPDVDSDGDGATDADEVENGSDPNDPNSVPSGGDRQLAGGGGCRVGAGGGGFTGFAALAALAGLVLVRRRRRR
jgi:MYXO-CTERM domain-containing protein